MKRFWLLMLGIVMLPSAFPFLPAVPEVVWFLTLGWLYRWVQDGPDLVAAPWVVLAGLASLVGFAATIHPVAKWAAGSARPERVGPAWRVRDSARLAVGLLALVAGGVAAAGVGTQSGRLFTSGGWTLLKGRCTYTRKMSSANDLRQIGLGLLGYAKEHNHLPPGATFDSNGIPLHGWPTLILPYTDEVERYNMINFSRPWDDPTLGPGGAPGNQALTNPGIETGIGLFKNPGVVHDPNLTAPLDYASNAWVLGGDQARRLSTITDGTATTLLGGEAAGDYKPWGYPIHWRDPNLGINRAAAGFGGPFPGGANFLFADGSVRFLRNAMSMATFRALATPDGGEMINSAELDW